ncbi:MAG TPA: DUF4333 domain-containing protein, partial [Acidimicrobiales bacterium]|nr:DUF4333 domain-containing protein [Acidimicrobiales bacterium]
MRFAKVPGLIVVALLGATAGLAGCSISARNSLSSASVEAKIASELATSYDIAPPPVHCPRQVPAEVGSTFTCVATLEGQHLQVVGTVTSSRGHVEVHPTSAVVVAEKAEAEIGKSLSATFGQPVTVSCPIPSLLVAPVGHTFQCTAHVAGVDP